MSRFCTFHSVSEAESCFSRVSLFVTPWTIESWNSRQNTGKGSLFLLQYLVNPKSNKTGLTSWSQHCSYCTNLIYPSMLGGGLKLCVSKILFIFILKELESAFQSLLPIWIVSSSSPWEYYWVRCLNVCLYYAKHICRKTVIWHSVVKNKELIIGLGFYFDRIKKFALFNLR